MLHEHFIYLDICSTDNEHDCDENATCTPEEEGYACECNDGFAGDGENCTGNVIT